LLHDATSVGADVDVILVSWNTRDLLRSCIGSLVGGSHQRLARVIVVDNASSDGSAAMVLSEFPRVDVIASGTNTGYAAGNNLGLNAATGSYVLLLNPDTEIPAGAVDTLAGFLDEHPGAGVVAPQLVGFDGQIQRSCRSFPSPGALFYEKLGASRLARIFPGLGAYRMAGWAHDTERQVDQPMGTALMVRRQAVHDVGGMDEQFPLFFNEVDWLYRIKHAGWEVWFTPSARVRHLGGASTRQVWVRAAWLSHTGLHAFYRKHFRARLNPVVYSALIGVIYARAAVMVLCRLIQQVLRRQRRVGL
jgi:GT2 family glycosyltransferase